MVVVANGPVLGGRRGKGGGSGKLVVGKWKETERNNGAKRSIRRSMIS